MTPVVKVLGWLWIQQIDDCACDAEPNSKSDTEGDRWRESLYGYNSDDKEQGQWYKAEQGGSADFDGCTAADSGCRKIQRGDTDDRNEQKYPSELRSEAFGDLWYSSDEQNTNE